MREYPTDEELERLISELESQGLYAPRYMKEQILDQAFPKKAPEIFRESQRNGTVQTFTYRLKIITGMAAALIMLILLPSLEGVSYGTKYLPEEEESFLTEQEQKEGQSGHEKPYLYVNEIFGEKTRMINRKFNVWFEHLNSFQLENLFDNENGGIYYED